MKKLKLYLTLVIAFGVKLTYITFLLGSLAGCKDDCPVEPDPCADYPEKMEITLMWPNYLGRTSLETPYVPTADTAFSLSQLVIFKTNFDYDSVFWQFGSDPRVFNQLSYSINFTLGQEGKVTARAICYRDTNTNCFGVDDDGIDTLYKTITLHHYTDAAILGTYRGTVDGKPDSINIRLWYDTLSNGKVESFYSGIPNGQEYEDNNIRIEHSSFYGADAAISLNIHGAYLYGKLESDGNTLKVYWREINNDTPELGDLKPQSTFTGKRIN
jgi:hypothetical protein